MKNLGNSYETIEIFEQTLRLLPQRCLYWANTKTVVLADWHLGKATHFRKFGIAVPQAVQQQDFVRLNQVLQTYPTDRLIIAGDLFHSELNSEWHWLENWKRNHQQLDWLLVAGNHDRHALGIMRKLLPTTETHTESGLVFTHEPLDAAHIAAGHYNLAGHVHPTVTLRGTAQQRARLPCFWFGERQGLLPAFGEFTGGATLSPSLADRVFVATGKRVIKV